MKKILLTLILVFSFSFSAYGLEANYDILDKYFYKEKLSNTDFIHYSYNYNKYNTLSFSTLGEENENDYSISLTINLENRLDNLLDIRFFNDDYIFIIYDFSIEKNKERNFILLLFEEYDLKNALNKVIETLKKGNITIQYTTTDKVYKYKIDNETSKIFAEILLYSSKN
ncbi:hypothetical protein [Brachyspira intermedia]|uniref:hypothetical protein n=1 Tax=Brachyspira intermedia TaxID=84377 RepID=UPI003005CD60